MNLFQASIGKDIRPLLIIINGESNSGGYALNLGAPGAEVGIRSSVQILNNTSFEFENLNIGTNNLIDHNGLSCCSTHGFELELANRADIGSGIYKNVHLIKTGQGGSTISQWNVGGTYMNKFEQRINIAKNIIDFNKCKIGILYSLGINDAIAGTNITTWKTGVTNEFAYIRSVIGQGDIPIIMTEFQGMGGGGYPMYVEAIQELAAIINNVDSVSASGASLRDSNHWDYTGMKLVAGRLLDQLETYY